MNIKEVLLRTRPDVNVTNKEMDKLMDEMYSKFVSEQNWEMCVMIRLIQDRFRVLARDAYKLCTQTCELYPLHCKGCNNNIYEEE